MSVFKFEYKPENELGPKMTLLTPGEASFKIVAVFDKKKDGSPLTTMDGTPKLTLSISVKDINNETSLVYDDLTAKTAWKLKAIADSIGMPELYDESGTLDPDDLIGCEGRCKIKTNQSPGYDDRTAIEKYLKQRKKDLPKTDYSKGIEDEDLPF